jgi:small subunit ribosomal protein S2
VAQVSITELLEAGVHFGHQTRRWNPKMRRFIHGERGGIYIIDLIKTSALLAQAQEFAGALAHRGGTVLFVGTKKQARDTIRDVAEAADMPYVNHRWLGGLLTNYQTISLRIRRLHDLERFETEGQLELLPTRERMAAQADLEKLRANLGGVKNMQRVPNAMFVIDLKTELIAVREAQRLRIPIIGVVDTNCDPDGIDFVIPGNDDAIRSCALITQAIGEVVAEGHSVFRAEEERARLQAEEKARAEAEARARREAEEQAKRQAEEQAANEAAAAAAAQAAATPPTTPAAPAQPPTPAAPAQPPTPAAPAQPPTPAAPAQPPTPATPAQPATVAAAPARPSSEPAPEVQAPPGPPPQPASTPAEAAAGEDTPAEGPEQPAADDAPAGGAEPPADAAAADDAPAGGAEPPADAAAAEVEVPVEAAAAGDVPAEAAEPPVEVAAVGDAPAEGAEPGDGGESEPEPAAEGSKP